MIVGPATVRGMRRIFDAHRSLRHNPWDMVPRSLATALIEAETAYLEAMVSHEAERSQATYKAMAVAARRLDLLETFEAWWQVSRHQEAANAMPLQAMQLWRGAPR